MRINKFLASCELGSRRHVEEFVTSGRISVNNKIIKELSFDISDEDEVAFDGKIVKPTSKKVYIMLNKPRCYITSLKDEKDRKVVTALLKKVKDVAFDNNLTQNEVIIKFVEYCVENNVDIKK